MDIQAAITKLERAGSEHSRANRRLREAATALSIKLEESGVPIGVKLPRGYKFIERRSNIGSDVFLVDEDGDFVDTSRAGGYYLHGDFNAWIPGSSREAVLSFARAIADGWLDELNEWMEERTQAANKAAETIEASTPSDES